MNKQLLKIHMIATSLDVIDNAVRDYLDYSTNYDYDDSQKDYILDVIDCCNRLLEAISQAEHNSISGYCSISLSPTDIASLVHILMDVHEVSVIAEDTMQAAAIHSAMVDVVEKTIY